MSDLVHATQCSSLAACGQQTRAFRLTCPHNPLAQFRASQAYRGHWQVPLCARSIDSRQQLFDVPRRARQLVAAHAKSVPDIAPDRRHSTANAEDDLGGMLHSSRDTRDCLPENFRLVFAAPMSDPHIAQQLRIKKIAPHRMMRSALPCSLGLGSEILQAPCAMSVRSGLHIAGA